MDEDGFAKLSYWSFVVYLGTLVQDGLAHMRGVTWRAVPAKFKTGMFEMNIIGSEICGVSFWNVGSGLAHMHGVIWKAAPAKFKRDVRDENLGLRFVVYLWNVGSGWVGTHAWCNLFRVVPAKFKTGMCEMPFSDLKFVVCLGTLVQDGLAHMRCDMESCSGKVQKRDV